MTDPVLALTLVLGVGMLLGVEREWRKGGGSNRAEAGVRTFALVGLAGGRQLAMGGAATAAVALGFVALAAVVGYVRRREEDPGLTTEVALVVDFLFGALAQRDAALAAGVGVAFVKHDRHDLVEALGMDRRQPCSAIRVCASWRDPNHAHDTAMKGPPAPAGCDVHPRNGAVLKRAGHRIPRVMSCVSPAVQCSPLSPGESDGCGLARVPRGGAARSGSRGCARSRGCSRGRRRGSSCRRGTGWGARL
jgi:hypothetical protein